MQLYLDCDGVLADFDRGATELLGMPPRAFEKQRGIGAFWQELARHPDFYGTLPLMPDAMRLFEAVRQLNPVILTGLPRGKWAAPQKVRWAAEHFPGTRILTVMAVDKRNHAQQGDILVDDQLKHAPPLGGGWRHLRPPHRCREHDREARGVGRASPRSRGDRRSRNDCNGRHP